MASMTIVSYIVLYLAILNESVHRGLGSEHPDVTRIRHQTPADSVALQKAAQRLLGLRDIPTNEGVPTDFDVKMAPKYMLDLYEKYKDGRIRSGKRVANTVRSIQAQVGVINTQTMFVFNLSSILLSERILKAEVHLFKRRAKHTKESDIYMEMNELGPTFLRKLDHRRIPEVAYGWQAADVTTAVEACLGYDDGFPRMMALGFSAPKGDDDKLERMTTRALIRRISRPYLVVYSNDTQKISVDHIQPHIQPADLTSTYVNPSTGLIERFSTFSLQEGEDKHPDNSEEIVVETMETDRIVKPDNRAWYGDNKFFEYFSTSEVTSKSEYKTNTKKANKKNNHKNKHHNEVHLSRRHRRSVVDNEIPEDPDDPLVPDEGYHFPKTHPSILQSRTQYRLKLPRKQGKLIPYPENYKKQRRKQRKQRRKHRKPRRNREKHQDFSTLRHDWDLEGVMSLNQVEQLCSKRTLSVDFADIGWSEWIISPRSFEANYCSGNCPFPLAQKVKPSNHATIQSLVHAIGLNSQVPGPCCVPDKMSAVTLLYFDESQNVVLKNYPEMSVDSCSCR